jgi:hypothetical protein
VHCVIIGFGLRDPAQRWIFDYAHPRAAAQRIAAKNINPYLVDAPDVLLPSRTEPPSGLPQLKKGSQPTDGGHLILTDEERAALLATEPEAEPWLRRYGGGHEFINGGWRWCLWLKAMKPQQLRRLPEVQKRVRHVRDARLRSPTKEVREAAAAPMLFTQDRQPSDPYLAIPEVSSEARPIIPMGFLPPDIIASNKLQVLAGGTKLHFGILTSAMHMAWVRAVCGRLESRYSYAPAIYNNFPWPSPSDAQRKAIETAAQAVLDARAAHPGATLADLYDPLAMPPNLRKAHDALDRVVDAAYGQPRGFPTEAARLAFLFTLYQSRAAPLDAGGGAAKRPAVKRKPRLPKPKPAPQPGLLDGN